MSYSHGLWTRRRCAGFSRFADGVTVTEVSDLEPVTQSGVVPGLARLEEEIGTPLLRRSGRRLRMTRAGAIFKRHVDAVLHHLDDGIAAVNELLDPDTGNRVPGLPAVAGHLAGARHGPRVPGRSPGRAFPPHPGPRRTARARSRRRPGRPGDRHARPPPPGPAHAVARARTIAPGPCPATTGSPGMKACTWPRYPIRRS